MFGRNRNRHRKSDAAYRFGTSVRNSSYLSKWDSTNRGGGALYQGGLNRNAAKRHQSKKNRTEICFRIFALLSLAIMVLIFCFSAQEADESSAFSDGFFALLMSGKIPILSPLVIRTRLFDYVPIRKCAHATIYFLLGCSVCAAAGFYDLSRRESEDQAFRSLRLRPFIPFRLLLPWGICVFYACTDEFHQRFVEGRSGEIRDVLIDGSGAAVGVLLIFLVFLLASAGRGRRRR